METTGVCEVVLKVQCTTGSVYKTLRARSHWVSASAFVFAMSLMQMQKWMCNPFSNDVADADADADTDTQYE